MNRWINTEEEEEEEFREKYERQEQLRKVSLHSSVISACNAKSKGRMEHSGARTGNFAPANEDRLREEASERIFADREPHDDEAVQGHQSRVSPNKVVFGPQEAQACRIHRHDCLSSVGADKTRAFVCVQHEGESMRRSAFRLETLYVVVSVDPFE